MGLARFRCVRTDANGVGLCEDDHHDLLSHEIQAQQPLSRTHQDFQLRLLDPMF